MLGFLLFVCACTVSASSLPRSNGRQEVLKNAAALRDTKAAPRVAVVGSGIAGAVAAFNVYEGYRNQRSTFDSLLPEITVFERNPVVGGRITEAFAYDDPFQPIDTCAQYFGSQDRCVSLFAQSVGLQTQGFPVPPSVGTAAWNGTNFIGLIDERGFRGPRIWSPFKAAKYFQRYGALPFEFDGNGTSFNAQFDTILPPFFNPVGRRPLPPPGTQSNVKRNLNAVIEQVRELVTRGVAGECDPQMDDEEACERYANFVREVLDPSANERYFTGAFDKSPPARLNALAVYRSYQDLQSNVVINGGNLRLIERLLTLAQATIYVNTTVTSIEQSRKAGLDLIFKTGNTDNEKHFDLVILAAPYSVANIKLSPSLDEDLDEALKNNPGGHLDTFVTHFTTAYSLNATFFDRSAGAGAGSPQRILSSAPFTNDPPFVSLRLVKFVTPPQKPGGRLPTERLYRLVTREAPDLDLLTTWLNARGDGEKAEITWVHVEELPLSTPIGYGGAPIVEDIEIAPGIIYAGAGEQVIGIADFACKNGANAGEFVIERLLNQTERGINGA